MFPYLALFWTSSSAPHPDTNPLKSSSEPPPDALPPERQVLLTGPFLRMSLPGGLTWRLLFMSLYPLQGKDGKLKTQRQYTLPSFDDQGAHHGCSPPAPAEGPPLATCLT